MSATDTAPPASALEPLAQPCYVDPMESVSAEGSPAVPIRQAFQLSNTARLYLVPVRELEGSRCSCGARLFSALSARLGLLVTEEGGATRSEYLCPGCSTRLVSGARG